MSGDMPPPTPQSKSAIWFWGYPEAFFMETQLTIFVHTPTNWNHLSDDQVKAPTLQDFKQLIVTPSAI